jgi:hypothetical protein
MVINLGDYVGKLLSEISKARVQADIEAVRIAELYARDPLLKNFPIPRVRLPKVEIEAPVVITGSEEDTSEAEKKLDIRTIESISNEVVAKSLKSRNISLNREELSLLSRYMKVSLVKLQPVIEKSISSKAIVKHVTDEVITHLRTNAKVRKNFNAQQIKELSVEISKEIDLEVAKQLKPLNRIKISPLTSSIKEVGDQQKVTTLKLSIVEEGIEWTTISEDDTENSTLVPE